METAIICTKEMRPSYRIILLYLSKIGKYRGYKSDLCRELHLHNITVGKGLKYLHDEGFIKYEVKYCDGIKAEYLGYN